VLSSGKESGESPSIKKVLLEKELLKSLLGTILAILYFSASFATGGEAYNLVIAGALIGLPVCLRLINKTFLERIMRYMFVTGVVMGLIGVLPPLYFAIVYGIFSTVDLMFSIVCMILTLATITLVRF